jgi:hypothetical protein
MDQTLNESVEELEKSLDFIYTSNSFVDQALTASDNQVSDTHLTELVNLIPQLPTTTVHSSGDSDTTELSEYTSNLSTNTSLSIDAFQHKGFSRPSPLSHHIDVTLNLSGAQSDPLSNWKNQSTTDDPARWLWSQLPETKYEHSSASPSGSGSITPRTVTLEERAQKMLEEAEIVADREANAYWTWDQEAHQYKHFDDGSEEPVWYCPYVT